MILPFSTQMNGKPTYFVEKIQRAISSDLNDPLINYKSKWFNSMAYFKVNPKLHTIREDKNDRWQIGTKIDFFINCRQKNMFRFAPVLPVVSTQKIEIVWVELFGNNVAHVFIDKEFIAKVKFGSEMMVTGNMLQLAQNDGFDTIEDFFSYFNEDFKGKIIHWTDLRY